MLGLGLTELLLTFYRLVQARRWDWAAVALVAAAYGLRLVTQLVQ